MTSNLLFCTCYCTICHPGNIALHFVSFLHSKSTKIFDRLKYYLVLALVAAPLAWSGTVLSAQDQDPSPKRVLAIFVFKQSMPGLSGLDLQDELIKRGISIPIIFITGHGTVSMSVRAMKAGAMDFLRKPFEDQKLLDAIYHAIKRDRNARMEQAEIHKIKQRIASLTLREHEILVLVIAGMLNKRIACKLEMSENTVKTHRSRIMQKMQVKSLAKLVRATEKVGIDPFSGQSSRS